MSWKIDVQPVGPLQMNSVLLTADGPAGPEALLIDPGEEPAKLLAWVKDSACTLKGLLCTHAHFDHIGAAAAVQKVHDLPLRCHPDDLRLVENLPVAQAAYGFPATQVPHCTFDLAEGLKIPFAGGEISVHHVPGHSPGQVMFLMPNQDHDPGCAIVGDCIFAGSVGRTDLPGGDFPTLEKSIRERIYTLPDETVIVCGHGPDTTVGREKASNPFVRP